MSAAAVDISARRRWMGVLAKAPPEEVTRHWQGLSGLLPGWSELRPPEVGLVLVRGRAGGDGAPFNLGEMTVTRCSVRLETGAVGHAWVAGRSAAHARTAAVIDALMQDEAVRSHLECVVIAPLENAQAERRAVAAAKAAATRVDFFTLVRGED